MIVKPQLAPCGGAIRHLRRGRQRSGVDAVGHDQHSLAVQAQREIGVLRGVTGDAAVGGRVRVRGPVRGARGVVQPDVAVVDGLHERNA